MFDRKPNVIDIQSFSDKLPANSDSDKALNDQLKASDTTHSVNYMGTQPIPVRHVPAICRRRKVVEKLYVSI